MDKNLAAGRSVKKVIADLKISGCPPVRPVIKTGPDFKQCRLKTYFKNNCSIFIRSQRSLRAVRRCASGLEVGQDLHTQKKLPLKWIRNKTYCGNITRLNADTRSILKVCSNALLMQQAWPMKQIHTHLHHHAWAQCASLCMSYNHRSISDENNVQWHYVGNL